MNFLLHGTLSLASLIGSLAANAGVSLTPPPNSSPLAPPTAPASAIPSLPVPAVAAPEAAPLHQSPPASDTTKTSVTSPLRIHLICEARLRGNLCPKHFESIFDKEPLLQHSPRSDAEVTLFVMATPVGNDDVVLLRFVSAIPRTPPSLEIIVRVDTRALLDEQESVLEAAFLRGIALYLAEKHPGSSTTVLKQQRQDVVTKAVTPWDVSLTISGHGNGSSKYKTYGGNSAFESSYTQSYMKIGFGVGGNLNINDAPPLRDENGNEISIDSKSYEMWTNLFIARDVNANWSVVAALSANIGDPSSQFSLKSQNGAGIEYNYFPSDHARGNRLGANYYIGYNWEKYNLVNVLDEEEALFPYQYVSAFAAVKRDQVEYGLRATFEHQLLKPGRRNELTLSPSITMRVGDHIDLSTDITITRRTVPDSIIDETDFQQVQRSSYAEPLSITGSLSLTIHFDRTNEARFNRFD
jgi:hypothetical protein